MGMNAKELDQAMETLYEGIDNIEYFTPTRQISEKAFDAAWDLINAHKEGDIVLNVPDFLKFMESLEWDFFNEKFVNYTTFARYSNKIKEKLLKEGESK